MGSLARFLLLTLNFSIAAASSITISDPFDVPGNSDVVGDSLKFDAQSVRVGVDRGTLTIDILTNYDNPNLFSVREKGTRLNPGDIFFIINGVYRYGIPIAYHNGPAGGPWGERLLGGHIYEINDPGALLNARQVLHDPMYLAYRPDATVWMLDVGGVRDVTTGTTSVQVLPVDGNDGVNGPLYDIRVITSLPAGLFSSAHDTYDISFAVATGGEDMVGGRLNFASQEAGVGGAQVPEPSTWYLTIGAALVGVARLAFRRR